MTQELSHQDHATSLMPIRSGVLQRQCDCGNHTMNGACDECAKKKGSLQRKASGDLGSSAVPNIVHEVIRSNGQPLDLATRDFMEPRFGHDFSQVRVHTDAKAAESARSVNALAYTVGSDIVFGSQQYLPETSHGRSLLAHELAHVAQSSGSASHSFSVLALGDSHSQQEREADHIATRVVETGHTSTDRPAFISTTAEPHTIQRVLIEGVGIAAAASLAAVDDRNEVCVRFWVPGRDGRVSWSGIDQETLDENVRLKSEDDLSLKKATAGDTDTLDAVYFGERFQRRILKVPDHCTVEFTNALNNRTCCCNLAGKAAAALTDRATTCRSGTAEEFHVANNWEPDRK